MNPNKTMLLKLMPKTLFIALATPRLNPSPLKEGESERGP